MVLGMSFLVYEASNRLKGNNLIQVCNLIHWEGLGYRLGKLGRSGYGPNGYDPLKMLKAIILQAWHSLSDGGLEEALRVRLDFMVITGLLEVPDETTLCRFRNKLMELKLLEPILRAINKQLEEKGLKVEASKGAIVDATVIQSAARPKKELEVMAEDRAEEDDENVFLYQETLSQDPDASWLKKGTKSYFGYKGFMVTDAEDGFIDHVHVTPAHVSENREFEAMIPYMKPNQRVYGDKGYASKKNQDILKARGLKNGLMHKAARGRPLSPWQKAFNRLVSQVRYKVEQGFGILKRRFQFRRASYLTQTKVQGQMILKAIAFNLLKAFNKRNKGRIAPA